ncbi:MAG: SAM-dependent methyltransferase [Planctomycetaceae bacterium]|nr:SAM-dependent methyltransferase [Planctomycetaceae bacterium]
MRIDFPITLNRSIETESPHAVPLNVAESYDGTNVVFRALRLATWGPTLLNLGYYTFGGSLSVLNVMSNMELAQQRLVRKSIDLLQVSPGDQVLDVACGRGKSSFMVQALHPQTTVIGIDLLDRNVQVARTLFDQVGSLSYRVGNAMDLDFPDASFDRVMCLEAAFHFPDRQRFLRESARVLRPGGRLVIVDFAWNSDAERIHRDDPETRIVREIWQWSDFSSIPEYERMGRTAGFRLLSSRDWSQHVTRPIQTLFERLSALGRTSWGRRILAWINPLYRSFSTQDWEQVALAVRGHEHVRRFSKYMAFIFEKR